MTLIPNHNLVLYCPTNSSIEYFKLPTGLSPIILIIDNPLHSRKAKFGHRNYVYFDVLQVCADWAGACDKNVWEAFQENHKTTEEK